MANENGFNGYRFLVDANNSRQYAVPFVHGNVAPPIRVFAEDPRDDGFKRNEVVFAFDEPDENAVVKTSSSNHELQTVAYQINVNESARASGLLQAPVSYQMIRDHNASGASVLRYELTSESIQDMKAIGFDPAFPRSFVVPLDKEAARMDMALLGMLPFPPQHSNGAFIARDNIDAPSHLIEVVEERSHQKDTTKEPQRTRPANDFNTRTRAKAPDRANYRVPDATIEALIKEYCKDLTAQAADGLLDPVIGREEETNQALKVLTRRKQSSLCFTGDAGVGKSAMFAAIAQRIVDDSTLPETLQGARVLELDLQKMNAGAKYRGQFEEKLKPLIDGLQEREGILKGCKIIMAIDEIHSQLTAGKAEGGTDSANMMKPFLTAKGISVMGTTTDDEYKSHIEKDGALGRRFEKLRLLPPNEEDTAAIIKRLWPLTKEHNHLTTDLTDKEISYIVTMTNRYAPQEAQPSKAEKVMNNAAASAEFAHRTEISRTDILGSVAQMSNLPLEYLQQGDRERILALKTELPKRVLGQPGIQRIAKGLMGARSGLTPKTRPLGCFVLQGPTGTGKTETAKALALYLFGTEDALIKLDMSEYAEKHSVSRLIGAPPGYVGFDSAEPALTEEIRKRPYCILVLDEIEKAHPDVYNVLLSVLNDGKMKDNQGKTVLFNNVLILMTTNIGAEAAMKLVQGRGAGDSGIGDAFAGSSEKKMSPEELTEKLGKIYEKAIVTPPGDGRPALFRPEMIGRIKGLGGFITFLPLTQEVVSNLVVRELDTLNKSLNSQDGANIKDATLAVSPEVMAQLAKEGYNPLSGARELSRVVLEKVINPFGEWKMENEEKLLAFIAENGPTKIVVDSLSSFEPKLVKAEVTVSNDNIVPAATKVKKIVQPKPKG